MFKANSLHYIVPNSTLLSNQSLPSIQTHKNTFVLVQDSHGHLKRRYEMTLEEFNRQFHLYEWRRKIHHPIPNITEITHFKDSFQRKMVSVLCQHINVPFTDLRPLKLEEIIYCMSEMLLGYQEIFARLGFVSIDQKLMGLNTKGEVLIWINDNLLAHFPENRKVITEKQIVIKTIYLLQQKAFDRNHLFFVESRKLQPKINVILQFMMAFKNKHKLKIIPKIPCDSNKSISERMLLSGSFSNEQTNTMTESGKNFMMKASGLFRSCQSQSQNEILGGSHVNSNQGSVLRNNVNNRASLMRVNSNNTPTNNFTYSVYDKSAPKINFNYSYNRQNTITPKQAALIRDYTSDRNIPFLTKVQSEANHIQQFTLDDKKSNPETTEMHNKKIKNQKKITQTYTLSYVPSKDTIYFQSQSEDKRSGLSQVSQCSFPSRDNTFRQEVGKNKVSMTTNYRSAVTQSFQSVGKYSNDEDNLNRKNQMFISNNSHRTTYSTLKESLGEKEFGKNAVSFVLVQSQENHQQSAMDQSVKVANSLQNNQKKNGMYTFGGLIAPPTQNQEEKQLVSIPEHRNSEPLPHPLNNLQRLLLSNQVNPKSIEDLYNNLYFNEQKKSLILDEGHYQVVLSPVKEEAYSCAKESFVIDLNQLGEHQPLSHEKLSNARSHKDFFTPKVPHGQGFAFDYNQWRGIKGLLNESNINQLKQSIHCGPEIRTPVHIKLQLLDKFGRQIEHSILPSTPSASHYSRAYSVCTIEEQPGEFK